MHNRRIQWTCSVEIPEVTPQLGKIIVYDLLYNVFKLSSVPLMTSIFLILSLMPSKILMVVMTRCDYVSQMFVGYTRVI